VYFFDEVLPATTIEVLYRLRSAYIGHLQGSLALFQGWPLTADSRTVASAAFEEAGIDVSDLDALPLPLVNPARVWLSLHAHADCLVSAEEGLAVMGQLAGKEFGRNACVQSPQSLLRSVRNGVLFPPYAHLNGNTRTFDGRSLASSLDQVGRGVIDVVSPSLQYPA